MRGEELGFGAKKGGAKEGGAKQGGAVGGGASRPYNCYCLKVFFPFVFTPRGQLRRPPPQLAATASVCGQEAKFWGRGRAVGSLGEGQAQKGLHPHAFPL